MPTLSYVHHLFSLEQCQAYLHTLRWKDRPLQCPRCQSHNVGPWGRYHYQPGLQRYRCQEKACKRTLMPSRAHSTTAASAPSPTGMQIYDPHGHRL